MFSSRHKLKGQVLIIRSAVACETCSQVTTVRIGMGQGIRQEHTIQCSNCSEPISFGMNVDYENLGTEVFPIENCNIVPSPPPGTGPVVNVDANFAVPEDMTDQDFSFHRIHQMQEMVKAAEAFGPLPTAKLDPDAPRRPSSDFSSEWKQLKKAVSLMANGHSKLALRRMKEASEEHYADNPLESISDWFIRFTMKLLGRKYQSRFKALLKEFSEIRDSHDVEPLFEHYEANMVDDRFARYREIFTDFFSKYEQFSQVIFRAALDLKLSDDLVASSVQFDAVKSFYGDAFEVFAGSVDLLAMMNNVKSRRDFDQFEKLTLDKYLKLDNSSKFNPFTENAVFTELCEERDNQLRNASHHKGFRIDGEGRKITYRAGKGGIGEAQEITYAEYLYRSVSLFLQICVLVCIELAVCSETGIKLPFD